MPRPLYGYRESAGQIIVDPESARVVRVILQAEEGARASVLRSLGWKTCQRTYDRVKAILRHRADYAAGRAWCNRAADPRLILAPM